MWPCESLAGSVCPWDAKMQMWVACTSGPLPHL